MSDNLALLRSRLDEVDLGDAAAAFAIAEQLLDEVERRERQICEEIAQAIENGDYDIRWTQFRGHDPIAMVLNKTIAQAAAIARAYTPPADTGTPEHDAPAQPTQERD